MFIDSNFEINKVPLFLEKAFSMWDLFLETLFSRSRGCKICPIIFGFVLVSTGIPFSFFWLRKCPFQEKKSLQTPCSSKSYQSNTQPTASIETRLFDGPIQLKAVVDEVDYGF